MALDGDVGDVQGDVPGVALVLGVTPLVDYQVPATNLGESLSEVGGIEEGERGPGFAIITPGELLRLDDTLTLVYYWQETQILQTQQHLQGDVAQVRIQVPLVMGEVVSS